MTPTPIRTVRVPRELWEQVQQKANDDGRSVSNIILQGLKDYLKD